MSGSRTRRLTPTGGGPRRYASAILDEQALAGALCQTLLAATGITNKSLRALMTGLLGTVYSMNQASYDLARLRLNGLMTRTRPQPLHTD